MIYYTIEKLSALPCQSDLSELKKMIKWALSVVTTDLRGFSPQQRRVVDTTAQLQEILRTMPVGGSTDLFLHFRGRAIDALELFFYQKCRQSFTTPGMRKYPLDSFKIKKDELLDKMELMLLEIEQDHKDFFSQKPSYFNKQIPDRIFNHVWLLETKKRLDLRIHANSTLPQAIRNQIINAFTALQHQVTD